MTHRKRLIEVALPLEAINVASAREKSIRHGHPSTLHLWWARRPLAAARAVIFSQMVDDPSGYVDVLRADPRLRRKAETVLKARRKVWEESRTLAEKAEGSGLAVPRPGPAPTLDEMLADQERQRLFRIIEDLVLWENTTNEEVLQQARDEIWASWRRTCAENADHPRAKELFNRDKLPAFHDPFAGGGALPLEAQRLGLEAYASDLNPVAALITKAMIEIPPKFAGRAPVHPVSKDASPEFLQREWNGAQGLADDVRYYGQLVRDEAEKRIGHLYPRIEATADMAKGRPDLKPYVGRKLTVIAWLWARTVKSPNPAFRRVDVPLASTFMLSTKAGKEAYVEPVIEDGAYWFTIKVGKPTNPAAAKAGTKLSRGANFMCLMSGSPIEPDHIYSEANAGRMGTRLMAIVVEGDRGRLYLPPTDAMEKIAKKAKPEWKPDLAMPDNPRWFSPPLYGLKTYGDLFTDRQLVALTTFADLVGEARERVLQDAIAAGLRDDGKGLEAGGSEAAAYSDAVATYLGLSIDKVADYNSSLVLWSPSRNQAKTTFSRQALPMAWDFAETNVFAGAAGDIQVSLEGINRTVAHLGVGVPGSAVPLDAQTQNISRAKIVSTDPPYYDNIGYADLSDFFYVWLRRSLRRTLPGLFATVAVPKAEELVATPYRHGDADRAEEFFLNGMTQAMHRLAQDAHPGSPVTIYYAFKQAESDGESEEGTTSTGWETFLEAVIKAGFAVTGTWPIRTEREGRSIGIGTNALASSIVLVCRPRPESAPTVTRRDFLNALKAELPEALKNLQRGNIAPVDLAQAAIGPGMAVYTRYSRVLDAEGKLLSVRQALALVNETLDEVLAEQEADFDGDTRWALAWFEHCGFADGEYGVAETLSKAKNTSVAGLKEAGLLDKNSRGGKVRLLKPSELDPKWDPARDERLTVWEMTHHLIRVLEGGGESAAATLFKELGAKGEVARELAYRLYTLCERKRRAPEALAYNGLVQSWPEIMRLAQEGGQPRVEQADAFEGGK